MEKSTDRGENTNGTIVMTAGPINTSALTSGIYVPKWTYKNGLVQQFNRRLPRDVKTSLSYTYTSGSASPLRIQGACHYADGRRAHSSYCEGISPKADAKMLAALTLKGIYSPNIKKSVDGLPLRPAMTKTKQVPGRYFPKAILSEDQKAVIAVTKPPKPSQIKKDRFPPIKGLDFIKSSISVLPNRFQNSQTSCNPKIAQTRKTLRMLPDVQSEIFAISFQGDTKGEYDPDSELHSDYYSIKRVNINSAKDVQTPKNQVRVRTSEVKDFRVVLRGQRKCLHGRTDEKDEETIGIEEGNVNGDIEEKKVAEIELPNIASTTV